MSVISASARPPSPWSGSRHEAEHRWQVDEARTLADAVTDLRLLVAELRAASAAGWSLEDPMRDGHLIAVRRSRRQRGHTVPPIGPAEEESSLPTLRWRVRLVDEPPVTGDEVLWLGAAERTPVVAWIDGLVRHTSGPAVADSVLVELTDQVAPSEVSGRRWGVARARVGPAVDLVADGSALRVHTVQDGTVVRTVETLSFLHAADGANTLLAAANAYDRLAQAAEAMAEAGGRLIFVDDGRLHITYAR